jgi:glycosyltransferase involved in cell wall biosynthesis
VSIAKEGTKPRRLCTIAARNYGPSVRLLVDTFAAHHPDIPVTVLFVDARPEDRFPDYPCEVIAPDALAMDRDDFLRMATYYDVTALSTALKPFFLQHLLDRGAESVMYLDPDIEVFAPLDDLFALANERQIVLTPHVMKPMPRDGLNVAEETILVSGQFNLGFITLSAAARPFLDYWSERTQMLALSDHSHAYFTDQRWVDAVPVFFEHIVCRDPSCNVAYWNLHERSLDVDEAGKWTVDGAPLRFFHYSGHDPTDPLKLSRHVIPPERILVDERPPLQRLLRERSERMLRLESPDDAPPYGWKRSADGIELDPMIRRLYWNAVRDAEEEGDPRPPHAFQEDGRPFTDWLLEPAAPDALLTRFQYALWNEYAHYQRLFPEPLGADAERFIDAARVDPTLLGLTPARLRPPPPAVPGGLPGVNLVGDLDDGLGVGTAATMVARMIRASGMPLATATLRATEHQNGHRVRGTLGGAPFGLSILASGPEELLGFAKTPEFVEHEPRTRVGVWSWEVDKMPASMLRAFDLVDEVWCASDHVQSALTGLSDRPVHKHPLAIRVPTAAPALTRADLSLPEDKFLFGFVFDYHSVLARKNPLGLIDAYRRAFGPADGAALVLKTVNASSAAGRAATVREAVAGRPDIHLLDQHFDEIEMRGLFHLLDCYTSLHRGEGLGLTIANAMAAGTPAIATGWSGNLEFMDARDSMLIPHTLVEVGPDAAPYPEDACWAEPDLDAAAGAMRKLFESPDHAAELGRCGRSTIAARGNVSNAALWFAERFGVLTGIEVRPDES